MTPNKYKVPKAVWKKFGEIGRMVYNAVREAAYQDTLNPIGIMLPDKDWKVVSHNFAFTAAFAAKQSSLYFKIKDA